MMEQQDTPMVGDLDTVPACRHHWMIEAPSGPTSKGYCQKCGEVREFRNSLPDPPRDDDAFSHFYSKNNVISRFKNWAPDTDYSYSSSDGYE